MRNRCNSMIYSSHKRSSTTWGVLSPVSSLKIMTVMAGKGLTEVIKLKHPNDGAVHLQVKEGWKTFIKQKLL